MKTSKVRNGRKKSFMSVFSIILIVLVIGAVLVYLYLNAPGYRLWSGPIYIKGDGSVDPPTAPVNRTKDMYVLTGDVYGPIVVERDNVTVDGSGYTVQGEASNDSIGVYVSGIKNVTIENMKIKAFWYGIYLNRSSSNAVFGSSIAAIGYGLYLESSSSNVVSGNNVANNGYGVYLEYSSNNSISGNNVTNNGYGIHLYYSSSNNVSGNNLVANYGYGLWLHQYSNYNSISGNTVVDNGYGIYFLRLSEFNTIFENNITANEKQGIWLHQSSRNSIHRNDIANNEYGIFFSIGFIGGSSDNLIYYNNFINNTRQVYIENTTTTHEPPPPPVNVWDNGLEGNYWSDYMGVDENRDGIGDSPYVITVWDSELKQYARYPLMGKLYSFNVSLGHSVDVISNFTIEGFALFEYNSTIRLRVLNMTVNQKYGFCRIRVPHALMNMTDHIVVNDAEPDYVNYTLYDDGYNRWIYFSYHD